VVEVERELVAVAQAVLVVAAQEERELETELLEL
jgi:hypothetical protein